MRRGFKHPLGESLPPPLSEETLRELYSKLPESKDELIRGFLRFGLSIAARYGYKHPRQIPDLVSEMTLALVDGVNKICNGAVEHHEGFPNIAGYLSRTISGALNRFVAKNRILPVHPETYKKGVQNHVRVLNFDIEVGRNSYFELEQLVDSCITNKREREVIDLRIAGLNDAEIGVELGLTRSAIGLIRLKVKSRLEEKLNGLG